MDLTTKEAYEIEIPSTTPPFKILQLVVWGPVGNALFYVHANNIYYKSSVLSDDVRQISSDGAFLQIYNGVPDWVYEGKDNSFKLYRFISVMFYYIFLEEVLSSNNAMWISPNGGKLAFAKFNDRDVQTMKLTVYGEPGQLSSQYTKVLELKYPKVRKTFFYQRHFNSFSSAARHN